MTTILSKDEYMTERALAEMWGLKRNTLQKWRSLTHRISQTRYSRIRTKQYIPTHNQ